MKDKSRKDADTPFIPDLPMPGAPGQQKNLFTLSARLKEAPQTRKAETLLVAIDLKLWLRKMNRSWADEIFLKVQHTYYGLLNDKTARTAQEELKEHLADAAKCLEADGSAAVDH